MSEDFRQREMRDRRGYRRSPVTLPEYRRGRPSPRKGRRNPPKVITKSEYRALLDSFTEAPTDVRDQAMVMLMYAGFKIGEVLALERNHYEPGAATITVPETHHHAERPLSLDVETRASLDRWMELRKARVRTTAPLFCVLTGPTKGSPINDSGIRQALAKHAAAAGIDRPVSTLGLRASGMKHRAEAHGRLIEQLVGVVDEADLESRYRDAFETWESAVGLFGLDPRRHARRIGEDCRAALLSFVDTALQRYRVDAAQSAGTTTKLRALLTAMGPDSKALSKHHEALIGYWSAVNGLDQRQAHEGQREQEELTPEDARRAVLYTLLVMVEVDRALPVT